MSRNLVICCDGTSNRFSSQNTNVVRLVQVLDRDPAKQSLYYDPGVGTLPVPGVVTRFLKWLSELPGLAFGAGLSWKVLQAYSFLMQYWEPGDRVFLFGFSRGAYTVRVLAGLLHTLGLMPRGNDNLVPYLMQLFKAIRKEGSLTGVDTESQYWNVCNEFRRTFARRAYPGDDERRFPVYFLGVWDTVSSVGWVWDPVKFPFTAHNPSIAVIRHAVSVDERRWFFRQNLMQQAEGQDFQQMWFAGSHCDIGGGYPDTTEDGGLWRVAFQWMLGEAAAAGLLLDRHRLAAVLDSPTMSIPWKARTHESLTQLWWPMEFFPKLTWRPDSRTRYPTIGMGRRRFVHCDASIHESTLLRIKKSDYAPPNLSEQFRTCVRGLAVVPDSLPYMPQESSC